MKRTFIATVSITIDIEPNGWLDSVRVGKMVGSALKDHILLTDEIKHEVVSVAEVTSSGDEAR